MSEWLEDMKNMARAMEDEVDVKIYGVEIESGAFVEDFLHLIQQAEEKEYWKEKAERYDRAFDIAWVDARDYGASRIDENIPDDKVAAYEQGAEDMFQDFTGEFKRALEDDGE